jgi:hypothetical protein
MFKREMLTRDYLRFRVNKTIQVLVQFVTFFGDLRGVNYNKQLNFAYDGIR